MRVRKFHVPWKKCGLALIWWYGADQDRINVGSFLVGKIWNYVSRSLGFIAHIQMIRIYR